MIRARPAAGAECTIFRAAAFMSLPGSPESPVRFIRKQQHEHPLRALVELVLTAGIGPRDLQVRGCGIRTQRSFSTDNTAMARTGMPARNSSETSLPPKYPVAPITAIFSMECLPQTVLRVFGGLSRAHFCEHHHA